MPTVFVNILKVNMLTNQEVLCERTPGSVKQSDLKPFRANNKLFQMRTVNLDLVFR